MLELLITFAEQLDANELTIHLDKDQNSIFLRCQKCPGIIFNIDSLKSSSGGIVNDHTAIKVLNEQWECQNKPKKRS